MACREDKATALLQAVCILHNVCVTQREKIRHSNAAGSRDAAWEDLPETGVHAAEHGAICEGAQTLREVQVAKLRQWKCKRPRTYVDLATRARLAVQPDLV